MKTTKIFKSIILGLFFVGFLSTHVHAQTNATIINGNVNLRQTYPTFGVSTLFKFKLTTGDSIAVIQAGTRIQVLTKKIVTGKYEWFEVIYRRDNEPIRGWIYAGEIRNRQYLKFDQGAESRIALLSQSRFSSIGNKIGASFFLIKDAHAQSGDVVVEPIPTTNSVKTLLLGAGYVILFMGSMFFSKKWIFSDSNLYTLLSSLCVLLILGFITDAVFSDLLGKLLV